MTISEFDSNIRPRVIAVIPGDGRGPSMISVRRQNQALIRAGVEVREFYLPTRTSPVGLTVAWRELRNETRVYKPNLIHAHYGTMTALIASFIPSMPLVVTFRGSDLNRHPSVSAVRFSASFVISQLSVLRASSVLCVSRQLRDRLWWRIGRTVILPTGVDFNTFYPISRECARERLGWSMSERIAIFSAGPYPKAKGFDLVEVALRIAATKTGPIRLVILDGTVPPEEIPLYLNGGDCLVFASLAEGSPDIIKEALACNLPIVSVDVGDVAERLLNVTPSIIAERDPNAFGRAIADVLLTARRSNGRDRATGVSEEQVTRLILGVYRSVLMMESRPQRKRS